MKMVILLCGFISSAAGMFFRHLPTEIHIQSNALLAAIFDGDNKGAREALRRGANPNMEYAQGMTPLLWALFYDNEPVVKLLLACGARINQADADGRTPLLRATLWGRSALACYLLEHGADSSLCDRWARTPYSVAVEQGDAIVYGALLKENDPYAYAQMLLNGSDVVR